MKRSTFVPGLIFALLLLYTPAWSCVGKTLVIAAEETPQGQVVAQVIAILINERTGTTVKMASFPDADAVHRALANHDADIAVEGAARALGRLGASVPVEPDAQFREAKNLYLEQLNLVWLPELGFQTSDGGPAAPVARKDTLKKFPALPRLIAKTQGLLSDAVVTELARGDEPAKTARTFLRERKLI